MRVGFYGKLPSHGDFVSRGVSEEFLNVWDRWLQACITSSKDVLGESWLDRYLTSPVWRFVLSPGAVGDKAYAGILFPSVDRVGRYFPMTAATELPGHSVRLCVFDSVEPWLTAMESTLLAALEREENDLDALALGLQEGSELGDGSTATPQLAALTAEQASDSHYRLGLGIDESPDRVLAGALFSGFATAAAPMTLWWTEGSTSIERSLLCVRGLPDPSGFAEMIDGFRTRRVWRGELEAAAPPPPSALTGAMTFRSSAATTPGRVRTDNEDSFCDRTSEGLWAVADGMGGHSHGEVASRMVTDALSCLSLSGSLETRAEQVRRSLLEVNAELRRLARTASDHFDAGTTIVAIVACDGRAAAIWAGDSRAYRLRAEAFEVLTTDHSEGEDGAGRSHVITRAVGGDDHLESEVRYVDLVPGDRILLCSDGVHGELSEEEVRSTLGVAWSDKLAPDLLDLVLKGPARDNATALVVECESGS